MALIALVAAMHIPPAFGCSVDTLKKVSQDMLDHLPSGIQHEFVNEKWSAEGGDWQMFEGESGTPHSIVVTLMGESGQSKIRISFLNRRDFVITHTSIDYAERITAENRSGNFKVQTPLSYFFCDGELQGPVNAETAEAANRWKKWFFEEAEMLKPEIQRVPE